MNLKPNDPVALNKDIQRDGELYARKGDVGVITEVFRAEPTGKGQVHTWYAKVRMLGGVIKTFRLTSLEKDA